uniref:Uncharacterized protein n=1 Tax=Mycena chlorophos TaxID=658473 RepID=A0ABQ0LRA6_MYCCL|nr:predicted protein [Mycena chlorophos]
MPSCVHSDRSVKTPFTRAVLRATVQATVEQHNMGPLYRRRRKIVPTVSTRREDAHTRHQIMLNAVLLLPGSNLVWLRRSSHAHMDLLSDADSRVDSQGTLRALASLTMSVRTARTPPNPTRYQRHTPPAK